MFQNHIFYYFGSKGVVLNLVVFNMFVSETFLIALQKSNLDARDLAVVNYFLGNCLMFRRIFKLRVPKTKVEKWKDKIDYMYICFA